jgi:hypothetical protein
MLNPSVGSSLDGWYIVVTVLIPQSFFLDKIHPGEFEETFVGEGDGFTPRDQNKSPLLRKDFLWFCSLGIETTGRFLQVLCPLLTIAFLHKATFGPAIILIQKVDSAVVAPPSD